MIFHENRLLADDFMKCPPLFLSKLGKMSQNLLSAAVVIGVLRANCYDLIQRFYRLYVLGFYFHFTGGSRGGGGGGWGRGSGPP